MGEAKKLAAEFAEAWTWREKLRWLLADKCTSVGQLPVLVGELSDQFGISVTLQTLKNYARVSKSFSEEHRHLQYKWSNFLAWSKWENPIKAMEQALDCGYSPRQMDNLRKHGDPHYKKPTPELCQVCKGELGHCRHDDWMNIEDDEGDDIVGRLGPNKTIAENLGLKPGEEFTFIGVHGQEVTITNDERQTGRVVQRDEELPSPKEDRCEAVGEAQEVREPRTLG